MDKLAKPFRLVKFTITENVDFVLPLLLCESFIILLVTRAFISISYV